nr:hypothetical protein [Tanacetum cinerariifolium]
MISNEFDVKLFLEYKVKCGHKVVKKELIITLRGDIYSVKFRINPEEDDVEPRLVLGRSFMRLTKGIADFENGTIITSPELDRFLDSSGEEEKIGDVWDLLLDDTDFGDILNIKGVEVSPFLKYSLLEEERLVIETIAYTDKYKKILDRICLDKMKLDKKIKKKEEEDITRIKGEALIEKEDLGAFVIPIRLEGREEVTDVKRGITMLNHSKAKPMGLLKDVLCQVVLNPFRKVCVWKKVVSFLGSLPVPLQHVDWELDYTGCFNKKKEGTHDDEVGSSRSKRIRQYETVEEVMLPRLAQFLPRLICSPCVVNWNVLNRMSYGEAIEEMLTIKLFVAVTNVEIFTSEAWTNAFNIDEPIYSELCHEFYSTYEFHKVCVADELGTKKIIKFRLCGRAFSWTLLEFTKSDEHFNAQEYWLSISREKNLSLSRSHASTMRNPVLRNLLSEEVLNSLSALIYYRALDTTTLRELIDSEGRLIPKAPEPGVPRVAILRPLRASMHDLYERMGNMEIRHVPLQGAYNPPRYDQQQYDQYYQQYPPQQQQPDDDE